MALQKESFAESAAVSREILAQEPEHITALSFLGSALVGLGEMDEARTVLKKCHALDPDSALPLIHLGESWVREDRAKAKAYWDKALTVEPGIPAYYARIGWSLIYSDDYDGGMAFLDRGLERVPDDRSIQMARAFIYEHTFSFENARNIYFRIINDNFRDIEVTARSVILLSMMGELGKAETGLEYLRTLEGDPKFIHYAEGFYYLFQEDKEKSLAAHLKAVEYR